MTDLAVIGLLFFFFEWLFSAEREIKLGQG